ncbi:MAG: hypothetical protein ABIA59_08245, partial [Candidatus Latescibacterota bacterium]
VTHWIDAGIGLSAKPTNLMLVDADDWFWAYDVGVLALCNLPDIAGVRIIPSIGIGILNVNDEVDYREYRLYLPDEIRSGVGLRIESPASVALAEHLGVRGPVVALSGLYEHMDRQFDNGKDGDNYGVELTFIDAFSMRVGHSDQIFAAGGTTYGMGFGWWYRMVRVQFDFASFPTSWIYGDARKNMYGVSIVADI